MNASKPWLDGKSPGDALLKAMTEHTYEAIAAAFIEWYESEHELEQLRNELEEWRTGKRKVFWKAKQGGRCFFSTYNRKDLKCIDKSQTPCKIFRVNIRPKGTR